MMAWYEPGKNDKPDNSSANNSTRKPDAPPDLDEVLRNLQKKLRNLLGQKKPIFSSSNPTGTPPTLPLKPILSFAAIIIVLLWFFSGFFIVGPAEKAVVLRFGKYVSTEEPGLHWVPSFISSRYLVNVQQVMSYPYQAEMLTQDKNIVSVDLVVLYRIYTLRDYLFTAANANESLQQATASALRQVIGQTKLDDILTSGREKVRQQTQKVLENTLRGYQTGLIVTDVNMQPAKPPEEVTAAFDDVIKAHEDEQRFENQANAYANRIVPAAQGNAARVLSEAKAYRQRVELDAQAATTMFLALLTQYQLSPQVTRERMYLNVMQSALLHTPKILLDTSQANNNLMYLPLDKLMKNTKNTSNLNASSNSAQVNTPSSDTISLQNLQSGASAIGERPDNTGSPSVYPNRPAYYDSKQGA